MLLFCHRITAKDLIHLKKSLSHKVISVTMEPGRPAVSTNVWTSSTVTGNHDICGSKYGCRYQMIAFTSNTFPLSNEVVLLQSLFRWCSVPLD